MRGGRTSDGCGRGKDEVNVEGESDGKWGDETHPRSTVFSREEGEGVRREEKRKTLTWSEGSEVTSQCGDRGH